MWRAIAFTWIGAFVEPPIAEQTAIAFSNAARVRIVDGLRSSQTISTLRFPVRYAISWRSRCGAGIAAHPGRLMPSASASEFMVVAVPMVLQWPADGADDAMSSVNFRASISSRASSSRAVQRIVPEPVRLPLYQPFSIGPPERTIAGMSTVAAAMICAGVVLSQPVVRTTPSSG